MEEQARKHPTTSSPPPAVADPPLKRQKLDGLDGEDQATPVTGLGMLADELDEGSRNGKGTRRNSGSDDSSDALGALRIQEPSANEWEVVGTGRKGKGKATSQNGANGGKHAVPIVRAAEEDLKRKAKKAKAKAAKERPAEFHFDTRGFKNRTIKLTDVRDLVLHINSNERAPNWMLIKNKSSIVKTVVLMVPGITPSALGVGEPSGSSLPFSINSATAQIPVLQKLYSHAMPTKATGDRFRMHSCMQTFMACPMSQHAKARRDDERRKLTLSPEAKDPTTYLLASDIMLEQGYPATPYPFPATASIRQLARKQREPPPSPSAPSPFEDWQRPDGWIQTPAPPAGLSGNDLKVLGVDCEMCLAESGSVLARVSVVDALGASVYDSLVQPSEPVVDYVTAYSGMTAERLQGVTTTLEDVQRRLAELVDFDTVLVGHSLECDLKALKLAHPWVIDTSVIYQHPKGPPFKPSLKWLAEKWLGKQIQGSRRLAAGGEGVVVGHDSEEDARAAVELLNKKLAKGPGFGEFANDSEAIFDRMARGSEPKVAAVVDHGQSGQWMAGRAKTSRGFKTDLEVVDGIIDCLDGHDFIVGRLLDLSRALGWTTPRAGGFGNLDGLTDGPANGADDVDVPAAYGSLSENLDRLYAALPKGTALVLFSGHGDPREMARLAGKKSRFDRLFKTQAQSSIAAEDRWMAEDERDLFDAVERVKLGLSLFCVK